MEEEIYNSEPETAPLTEASPATNTKLLIFLIAGPVLVLALLIGAVVWGMKSKPPGQDTRTSIEIYANDNPGFSVEDESDRYLIQYKVDNFEESFELPKSAKDAASMSSHLLQLAKSNSQNDYSPFYSSSSKDNSNSYKRIIDITLDVSGSVKGLASQDPGYYDKVRNKLKNLLVQENITPGDRVRVRFLGANPKTDQVYTIDFTGPKFTYTLDYQRAFDRGLITLTGYSLDKPSTQDPQVSTTASSIEELFDKVSSKHQEVVEGPAGSGTYLIGHLNEIINDNDIYAGNRFASIVYIVLTDGEFNLEPSVANKVGVGYCSIDTYLSCHTKLLEDIQAGEFLLGDRTGDSSKSLSINPSADKVFMVGLNKKGDPMYGQSLENFFSGIFKPINTIKFLD